MSIKILKIHILSLAKISSFIHAGIGVVASTVFGIMFFTEQLFSQEVALSEVAIVSLSFVLFLPILYAGVGFLIGALAGFCFNQGSRFLGGLEVETENTRRE